jgi:predicted alpha-1,6-mannanase (GH76 family)
MAEWHGYVLLSLKPGLTLTSAQKSKVRDTVRALAVREDQLPRRMFQARLSLDGTQAIYEAVWDREKVSPAAVVNTVAGALGVVVGLLAANVDYSLFADGGSWEESRQAALKFLIENAKTWEPEL